jgi:hypothetical protein
MTTIETLALEYLAEHGCVICEHPYLQMLETAIYEGVSNELAAERFGIGGGGKFGGELVRQHRIAGHMQPPEVYRGKSIVLMRERGDAIKAERAEGAS